MRKTVPAAPLPFSIYIQLSLLLLLAITSPSCFGEWAKTIQCPAGHIYRDLRQDAGREEFCEIVEPGFLAFKDGPYRSWFSEGHPGSSGNYSMGRQVGDWTECERFDRCGKHTYPIAYPREAHRPGFKPEVPVSFENGKYVIDFRSCRTTWVTQAVGSDPVTLNISGDYLHRCQISYLPQSVLDRGGKGSYVCRIPFEVGTRRLASLDLRKELPLVGLPQFCSEVNEAGEPLMIREGMWDVATTVDVECATVRRGNGTFEIRLNQFASDLVRKASANSDEINTLLCLHPITSLRISSSDSGRLLLTYRFSSEPSQAASQERCITSQFKCPLPCP